MKNVFVNRHAELRPGWRILIFTLLTGALLAVTLVPLQTLRPPILEASPIWVRLTLSAILALAGVLCATWIMTRFVNRKPMAAVGLWFHPSTVKEFLSGCLLGFLMISGITLVLTSLGQAEIVVPDEVTAGGVIAVLLIALVHFAAAALLEEVLFRGYPFQTLIQGVTLLPAVFIMALFFALAHLGNPNTSVLGIVNVSLAAVWLSVGYAKTKGLWLPFGLHLGWNFTQTSVYGFATSGVKFDSMQVLVAKVTGPEWLSGGAFGPEGGILATLALFICTIYLLKSRRFREQEGIITLDTVEDLPMPPTGGTEASL